MLESSGQTELFRTNVDWASTTAVGTDGLVEMTWEAAQFDQWQTISTPVRAPGVP